MLTGVLNVFHLNMMDLTLFGNIRIMVPNLMAATLACLSLLLMCSLLGSVLYTPEGSSNMPEGHLA